MLQATLQRLLALQAANVLQVEQVAARSASGGGRAGAALKGEDAVQRKAAFCSSRGQTDSASKLCGQRRMSAMLLQTTHAARRHFIYTVHADTCTHRTRNAFERSCFPSLIANAMPRDVNLRHNQKVAAGTPFPG